MRFLIILSILCLTSAYSQNRFELDVANKGLWRITKRGEIRIDKDSPNFKNFDISLKEGQGHYAFKGSKSRSLLLVSRDEKNKSITELSTDSPISRTYILNSKKKLEQFSACHSGGCLHVTPKICKTINSKLNHLKLETKLAKNCSQKAYDILKLYNIDEVSLDNKVNSQLKKAQQTRGFSKTKLVENSSFKDQFTATILGMNKLYSNLIDKKKNCDEFERMGLIDPQLAPKSNRKILYKRVKRN